jgi:hypothetical protein
VIQMSLHFDDADPVATCRTGGCRWHTHGDAINDAVLAWTWHVAEEHREDWDDEPTGGTA